MPANHPMELETVRLDRWLFAVRIFRTRSLAAKAIAGGRIKIEGQTTKAHRPVRIGDIIDYRDRGRLFRYEVTGLIEKRVGAAEARKHYLLTEDPNLKPEVRELVQLYRQMAKTEPKTRGRPTKRDRRRLDKLMDGAE